MIVTSINGHLHHVPSMKYDGFDAIAENIYPLHGFIVIEFSRTRVFYNQDGQEVFRIEREKQGFWGRFLSWVKLRKI